MGVYLLFSALAGFDRVVDVLHCPFNEIDCVWPLGLRVNALLCHNSSDIPKHCLQLSLPFLVRHLKLSFGQDLPKRGINKMKEKSVAWQSDNKSSACLNDMKKEEEKPGKDSSLVYRFLSNRLSQKL